MKTKTRRIITLVIGAVAWLLPLSRADAWPFADKKGKEATSAYDESVTWFKKGEDLIGTDKENSEEQATYFRRAADLQPDFYQAHYNLALIYANQNKSEAAIGELREVLRIQPDQENARFLLGRLYQDGKDDAQALVQFDAILKNNAGHLKALVAKAYSLANLDRTAESIQAYERALEIDPTPMENHYNLAMLYIRQKNTDKALASLQTVLSLDAQNPYAYYQLARLYFDQKKYRESAEAFQKMLAAKPSGKALGTLPAEADVRGFLSEIAIRLGDYSAAEKELRRLLTLDPKNDKAYYSLAFVLNKQNKPDAVIEIIKRGVDAHPNDAGLLARLADAYSAMGQPEEALVSLQKAVALQPTDKNFLYNLGTLYAQQSKLPEAEKALSDAIAQDSNFINARINLAIVYDRKNEEDKAREQYEKVLELGAKDAQSHFRLAAIYARQDKKAPALGHLEKALELDREKYLKILKEDAKNGISDLDNIRYTPRYKELTKELHN